MPKAYEMPFKAITLVPSVSFVDKRYLFATIDNTGEAVICGAGAKAVGVMQDPNDVGQPSNVMVSGVSFVVIGAPLAAGQEVQSDADGKAIPLAAGRPNGICVVGSGAINDIASILVY
jgi:hypothetical protein